MCISAAVGGSGGDRRCERVQQLEPAVSDCAFFPHSDLSGSSLQQLSPPSHLQLADMTRASERGGSEGRPVSEARGSAADDDLQQVQMPVVRHWQGFMSEARLCLPLGARMPFDPTALPPAKKISTLGSIAPRSTRRCRFLCRGCSAALLSSVAEASPPLVSPMLLLLLLPLGLVSSLPTREPLRLLVSPGVALQSHRPWKLPVARFALHWSHCDVGRPFRRTGSI